MFKLNSIYSPAISRPFFRNETYAEFAACSALSLYICCFWGTENPVKNSTRGKENVLVTPDTCMDLIIVVNHTKGTMQGFFSGMFDTPFTSAKEAQSPDVISRFAVRFYFWAAHLFAGFSFKDIYNKSVDLDIMFPDWKTAFEAFYYVHSIHGRIEIAEKYLLGRLLPNNIDYNLFNAVYYMLAKEGAAQISDICGYSGISPRKLERLFAAAIGVTPKKASCLIRYQTVWQSMLYGGGFNIHDAVERHGYADQPHLLNEFRRFHSVSPGQAVLFANANR